MAFNQETIHQDTFLEGSQKSFVEDIKRSLFEIFLSIMKDEEYSKTIIFFIALIKLAQLVIFCFVDALGQFWIKTSFFEAVNQGLDYIRLDVFLIRSGWDAYISGFYVTISVNFMTIGSLLVLIFQVTTKRNRSLILVQIYKLGLYTITTVGFYPFTHIQMNMFNCLSSQGSATQFHGNFPEKICYQGSHLVTSIFAGLSL